MTDLDTAKEKLGSHSVCFCKNGEYFTCDGRGISPLMKLVEDGRDVSGSAVADIIVGKAAATLFVKMGVAEVYGRVMSKSAAEFLEKNAVPLSYGTLTEKIINRGGDGICPMEQAVTGIDDVDEAYQALKTRLSELKYSKNK